MEFLILVVLFLIALGCEKAPEGNVYVAKRPARRAAGQYNGISSRAIRTVSHRHIHKVPRGA